MGFGLDTRDPPGYAGGSSDQSEIVHFRNFRGILLARVLVLVLVLGEESGCRVQGYAVAVGGGFHAAHDCVGSAKSFQLKFQIRS